MSRSILSQALPLAFVGLFALAPLASAQVPKGFSADPAAAPSGAYKLDPRHTNVTAVVVHMGMSNFAMRLKGVTGSLDFDAADPTRSHLDVTIDPASLDTGVPALDQEVVAAFKPEPMHFVSTAIEKTGPTSGRITGALTFHGVTRPVVLDAVFNGSAAGPGGKRARMGFSATGRLKRSEFGFTEFSTWASDDVKLQIETEFSQ
ncbi:MAG: YceI family protein [Proteobacteria bacterium]|nr:YceI family protein [Pseudomonadota bacterium]